MEIESLPYDGDESLPINPLELSNVPDVAIPTLQEVQSQIPEIDQKLYDNFISRNTLPKFPRPSRVMEGEAVVDRKELENLRLIINWYQLHAQSFKARWNAWEIGLSATTKEIVDQRDKTLTTCEELSTKVTNLEADLKQANLDKATYVTNWQMEEGNANKLAATVRELRATANEQLTQLGNLSDKFSDLEGQLAAAKVVEGELRDKWHATVLEKQTLQDTLGATDRSLRDLQDQATQASTAAVNQDQVLSSLRHNFMLAENARDLFKAQIIANDREIGELKASIDSMEHKHEIELEGLHGRIASQASEIVILTQNLNAANQRAEANACDLQVTKDYKLGDANIKKQLESTTKKCEEYFNLYKNLEAELGRYRRNNPVAVSSGIGNLGTALAGIPEGNPEAGRTMDQESPMVHWQDENDVVMTTTHPGFGSMDSTRRSSLKNTGIQRRSGSLGSPIKGSIMEMDCEPSSYPMATGCNESLMEANKLEREIKGHRNNWLDKAMDIEKLGDDAGLERFKLWVNKIESLALNWDLDPAVIGCIRATGTKKDRLKGMLKSGLGWDDFKRHYDPGTHVIGDPKSVDKARRYLEATIQQPKESLLKFEGRLRQSIGRCTLASIEAASPGIVETILGNMIQDTEAIYIKNEHFNKIEETGQGLSLEKLLSRMVRNASMGGEQLKRCINNLTIADGSEDHPYSVDSDEYDSDCQIINTVTTDNTNYRDMSKRYNNKPFKPRSQNSHSQDRQGVVEEPTKPAPKPLDKIKCELCGAKGQHWMPDCPEFVKTLNKLLALPVDMRKYCKSLHRYLSNPRYSRHVVKTLEKKEAELLQRIKEAYPKSFKQTESLN